MRLTRRTFLPLMAAPWVKGAAGHTFGSEGEHFLLDGKPFVIRSGAMHYPRVPRAYWRDRMKKMRALGLNTLETYVFWNLHEPRPGEFDFRGNLDLAEYIRMAQGEGFWVLLRPGPYICSEWDFGGLPAWLLGMDGMKVRSNNPEFLKAAGAYMQRVGKETAGLQITRGGPIVMVQVENEYGSFGRDHEYMKAIQRTIRDAEFDVTLYTSDGSGKENLAGGTLDDCLSVINFGDTSRPEREFANFAAFRQNVPRMCGEFWVGWFDHWGEKHHTTAPARAAQGLEWMLSRDISFNLYMAHGGSSFGYMSGANLSRVYEPDISGYDYDAPIDEAGRPTAKFDAIRTVIRKHLPEGTVLPDVPAPLPIIAIPRFELRESAPVTARLTNPVRSTAPLPMEKAGKRPQSYGLILYRTHIGRAAKGTLEVTEARDYAVISQGARQFGALDRRKRQSQVEVELEAGQPLDILVFNLGRVNFGPHLVDDFKGITEKVTLNGETLTGWEIYSLPFDEPGKMPFGSRPANGPALYRGSFQVSELGDTFLDLRGWGIGAVWVNGHNLGRYWKVGPQQSLFAPAPWLKVGSNEVIVLDLENGGKRSIAGEKDAIYETPA